ncbi:MAG TPA: phosphate acyltransferase [Anaeromyxobacteraceae bacterium]|jgi:phosphate butyryltransferase|nr:phosphate acyltransferase [Anaeromyxobacteraceae bacterium]
MAAIRSMRELVERAAALGPCRVVVPGADSRTALGAALEGEARGLVEPVLIGARAAIAAELEALGADPARYTLVDEPDLDRAARRAVALVRGEGAELVLKGKLSTAQLLKAVLDREHGLRGPGLLSDVLVTEAPGGEARLLGVTDGGLNVAPSLEDKRRILENAVRVFHRLGVERPRVALLCAIETPTPAMPHTGEAAALAAMAERGELEGCEVFGPVALDGALSPGAARAKGILHPAAGRADLIVVPNIETGNALGKAFTWLAERRVAHVVEGARAPVLIPSRAEGSMDKLCSLALGVLVARGGA